MEPLARPTTTIHSFLTALRQWIDRVEANKVEYAQIDSETAKIFGQLLAEDPDFKRIYQKHLDGCNAHDPERAIKCVQAFLNSVAERRSNGAPRYM